MKVFVVCERRPWAETSWNPVSVYSTKEAAQTEADKYGHAHSTGTPNAKVECFDVISQQGYLFA